ncbi:MAG: haloacid dehalogenase-like hydrolase [Microthrixaceae bacterium]
MAGAVRLLDGVDVLVVDLDGTITSDDTLELLRAGARGIPHLADRWNEAVATSKQAEKVLLHAEVGLDVGRLRYRGEVLELLAAVRGRVGTLALVTGSSVALARDVAAHVGGFDEVLGTTPEVNLTGPRKAAALVERYGRAEVWYVGDSPADVPVWRAVSGGVVVGGRRPEWMPDDLHRVVPLEVEDP